MPSKEGLASIDEIYAQVENDWQKLTQVFPRSPKRTPKVATLYGDSPRVMDHNGVRAVDQHDDIPPPSVVSVASYIPWSHTIAVNHEKSKDKTQDQLRLALTEEEVHAATYLEDSDIWLDPDSFLLFNGYREDFGINVVTTLRHLDFPIATLDMNEFFPPIGQSLLLGDDYPEHFDTWNIFYRRGLPQTHQSRLAIGAVMKHFPRLAGELLVNQYTRDIQALVHAQPGLFTLRPRQLWDNYCVPLLTAGKIE